MVKIFIKLLSSTLIITIFNYVVIFIASKNLSYQAFAYVGLIQYSLNIILRFGSLGLTYETLRYGNQESFKDRSYQINLKTITFGLVIVLVTGAIVLVKVENLFVDKESFLLLPIGLFVLFVTINAAALRSVGKYITSNIFDKALVITSVIIYLLLLSGKFFDELMIVYFIVVTILLVSSFYLLNKQVPLKKVFAWKTRKISGNIRFQMYFADLMFLASTSVDKLFINQSLSLEQLAIWLIYFQLFVPFQFAGRLIYQVFFPELSQNRFTLTFKKVALYVAILIAGTIIVYYPLQYFFIDYYSETYTLSQKGVALMLLMGFLYLLGVPSGVYLAAKMNSKRVFYNNIASAFLSIMLIIFYYYYSSHNFPYLMILALSGYYVFKIVFTVIIILNGKCNNHN